MIGSRVVYFFKKHKSYFYLHFLLWYVLTIFIMALPQGTEFVLLEKIRNPFLDEVFKILTKLGEYYPFLVAVILIFTIEKSRKNALFLAGMGGLVSIISGMLKHFFSHPRPAVFLEEKGWLPHIQLTNDLTLHVGYQSFPSGHTFLAFAFFTFIALKYSKMKINWVQIACFLCAFSVGFSRVYLVQHFVKDIYLGSILGFLLGVITIILMLKDDE